MNFINREMSVTLYYFIVAGICITLIGGITWVWYQERLNSRISFLSLGLSFAALSWALVNLSGGAGNSLNEPLDAAAAVTVLLSLIFFYRGWRSRSIQV